MNSRFEHGCGGAAWSSIFMLVFLLTVGAPPAHAQNENRVVLGGPKGSVKSSKGDLLEGMMIQLIAQKTGIRTTVYSNEDGHYEFPNLASGIYTLRIAQPREFRPFVKEDVEINGGLELDDIVLARATNGELLPPSPEIAAQMTGSEWLLSLSGTGDEKKLLTVNCNWCHSYQQIFRTRYDEEGWSKIAYRMIHGAGSPLINLNAQGRFPKEDEARLVKMLLAITRPPRRERQLARNDLISHLRARLRPRREPEKPRADHPQELRT